jgi:ketosteroid isomerase-like protein
MKDERHDEQVARIRRGYDAMNRGDFDAATEHMAADVEWHDPPELPDRRPPFRGRDALKQAWREYYEPFDDVTFEVGEIAVAEDRAFVELTLSGTGESSGARTSMTWYQVGYLGPDGTTLRLENYLERDRARSAAGLA